ncbi:hypothetical protein [Phytopseudomonas dryadis]|uniref:Uncharacterized protein n=1 Tax=Phytopseudomonas dryadis TaxID=2487520 RepID=A0A4Q9QYF7_9GAMM|nr:MULTISPECIES: hypothetical protein [Pseudomonas]TBU89996.1 hypothetical protein DNK44_15980 [Pseudomonas dryadis]TBV02632.1 hypothetical protein DNK34_18420 [Pseudomonas dryadis]TBV15484.1 hypothetical protein DNK41_17710 [Pseudomonas sp. FRB 230]
MKKTAEKVVALHQRDPQTALDNLNRITGLKFSHWPESLLPAVAQEREDEPQARPWPTSA